MTGSAPRTWVLVASFDHARRGVERGYIMANHGKRAPLARMTVGDHILIYSPKRSYPKGDPFQAIAIVGTVTGEDVEPSPVIDDGFARAADLREIPPLPLSEIRDHLPLTALRFGSFELKGDDAAAIWKMVTRAERR